VDKPCR